MMMTMTIQKKPEPPNDDEVPGPEAGDYDHGPDIDAKIGKDDNPAEDAAN